MKLKETKGDLFEIDREKWVLAHCISAEVTATRNMNKGIAKIFRNEYPQMAGTISKSLEVGKAIKYEDKNHVIYNLITKQNVRQKARGNY